MVELMPKKSELQIALDKIDAEIAVLQEVRVRMAASLFDKSKRKPRAKPVAVDAVAHTDEVVAGGPRAKSA